MNNKKKMYWHGEAAIGEVDSIPSNAKKLIPNSSMIADGGFIIAESETSGNHHVIEMNKGIEFYHKGDTLYMKVVEPAKVYNSVDKQRHPTDTLPPGIYRREIHKEYSNVVNEQGILEQLRRNVAD